MPRQHFISKLYINAKTLRKLENSDWEYFLQKNILYADLVSARLLVSPISILDPTNFVYLFIKMESCSGRERNASSIRFLWKA